MLQQAALMIFAAIMFSTVFGSGGTVAADAAWPLQHPVVAALGWIAVILIVTVPLAVRRYGAQR